MSSIHVYLFIVYTDTHILIYICAIELIIGCIYLVAILVVVYIYIYNFFFFLFFTEILCY